MFARFTSTFGSRTLGDYAIYQAINILVGIGLVPILTYLLGAGEYGKYALAATWVTAVHVTVFYATQLTVGRYSNGLSEPRLFFPGAYTRPLAIQVLIGCSVPWIGMWVGALPFEPHEVAVLAVVCCANGVFCVGMERWAVTRQSAKYRRWGNFVSVARLGIGVALCLLWVAAVSPVLVAWGAGLVVALIAISRSADPSRASDSEGAEGVRMVWRFGVPAALGHIFAGMLTWVPIMYVGQQVSFEASAKASVLIGTTVLALTVLPGLIALDRFPMALELHSAGQAAGQRRQVHQQLILLVAVAVLSLAVLIPFGPILFSLLTSNKLTFTGTEVIATTMGAVGIGVMRALEPLFRVSLRQAISTTILGVCAFSGCACIVWLTQQYGVTGALCGFGFSTLTTGAVLYIGGRIAKVF